MFWNITSIIHQLTHSDGAYSYLSNNKFAKMVVVLCVRIPATMNIDILTILDTQ